MLELIFPKEKNFFTVFEQISSCLEQATTILIKAVESPDQLVASAEKIEKLESEADRLTHGVMNHLHETFVTPFDRIHIQQFVTRLDEVIDLIHAVAERLMIYEIGKLPPETIELARKCDEAVTFVRKVVSELNRIKTPAKALSYCVEIHRVENEADKLLRKALRTLFDQETDIKKLLKLKEIDETLESITDRCEDLANTVEGIVLEYT